MERWIDESLNPSLILETAIGLGAMERWIIVSLDHSLFLVTEGAMDR